MVKQLSEMTPLQALEGLALDTKNQADIPLSKLFLILQEKLKERGPILTIDAAEEIVEMLGINQKHKYNLSRYIQRRAQGTGIHGVYHTTLGHSLRLAHGDYDEISNEPESRLQTYPRASRRDTGILYNSEENLINFIKEHTSRNERVVINCNF